MQLLAKDAGDKWPTGGTTKKLRTAWSTPRGMKSRKETVTRGKREAWKVACDHHALSLWSILWFVFGSRALFFSLSSQRSQKKITPDLRLPGRKKHCQAVIQGYYGCRRNPWRDREFWIFPKAKCRLSWSYYFRFDFPNGLDGVYRRWANMAVYRKQQRLYAKCNHQPRWRLL